MSAARRLKRQRDTPVPPGPPHDPYGRSGAILYQGMAWKPSHPNHASLAIVEGDKATFYRPVEQERN